MASCSIVELSAEGEKTRVLDVSEVTRCSYVGKTMSTTTDKVVGVTRHKKSIDQELVTLARNTAKKLGGNPGELSFHTLKLVWLIY